MPVHHIHMNPIGPLRLNGFDLLAEIGEIGGQDGWCDLDGAVKRHGKCSPRLICTCEFWA